MSWARTSPRYFVQCLSCDRSLYLANLICQGKNMPLTDEEAFERDMAEEHAIDVTAKQHDYEVKISLTLTVRNLNDNNVPAIIKATKSLLCADLQNYLSGFEFELEKITDLGESPEQF